MATNLHDAGPRPEPRRSRSVRKAAGVEGNGRLTAQTGAILFVLFAAEGVTILRVHALLTAHVFIGMVLVPPVLLKIGSTTYRFARYYLGTRVYREKGPPPVVLRLLGPVLVLLTSVMLASGIALLLGSVDWRRRLLFVHKASFILWFGAMVVHVLGHLAETTRLAPRDWFRSTRREVEGASPRQWLLAAAILSGILLALATVPSVGSWTG